MGSALSGGDIANRLLLSLPKTSLQRLLPALQPQATKRGDVIKRPDRPIDHHYFVNRGLISLIKTMQDGRSVEIGVIGIEGVSSPHALLGLNQAALDGVVQIEGDVLRISHRGLMDAMAEDEALHGLLARYAHFAYSAIAQTAACNRLHLIEQRCCRWLLIAHDSARNDTFRLNHEFLAMMLGVQRAGVTIAASDLQKAGLIRYLHGQVTITDRAGLEKTACECYATMQHEYAKTVRATKRSLSKGMI